MTSDSGVEGVPKGISLEAQEEALLAMVVPVIEGDYSHEAEDQEKMETIKVTIGMVKHSYRGSYCDGHDGPQQMIPHAMATEKAIEQFGTAINLSAYHKVLCFLGSLNGLALKLGHESLADKSADLQAVPPACMFK
jgi:hypothetical protein